ncbi:MAG: DUF4364 family protein [Lachnospiraceae bacterium]|nr:DUF4364 family protein [Lachnospiraceae bacterium]
MAEPNTIYKITILEMLDKVDFPLSNTQISNFFLEQDYTDYFTVQQIISGLIDSELIRSESTHSNTQYYITASGKETLSFFKDKISPAIAEDLSRYFENNKMSLKNENSIVADYYKSTSPGFDVRCQMKEKDISIIDLTIHVQNKSQAEAVCKNFQEQNLEIYAYLMDTLIH